MLLDPLYILNILPNGIRVGAFILFNGIRLLRASSCRLFRAMDLGLDLPSDRPRRPIVLQPPQKLQSISQYFPVLRGQRCVGSDDIFVAGDCQVYCYDVEEISLTTHLDGTSATLQKALLTAALVSCLQHVGAVDVLQQRIVVTSDEHPMPRVVRVVDQGKTIRDLVTSIESLWVDSVNMNVGNSGNGYNSASASMTTPSLVTANTLSYDSLQEAKGIDGIPAACGIVHLDLQGSSGETDTNANGLPVFDVQFSVSYESGGECRLRCAYNSYLYCQQRIRLWAKVYDSCLLLIQKGFLADHSSLSLSDVDVYGTDSLFESPVLFGSHSAMSLDEVDTVPLQLCRSFLSRSDSIAVTSNAESWTYDELSRDSLAVSSAMHEYIGDILADRSQHRVAILCDRSYEMVVAMVACVLSGVVYVQMDPSNPPGRLLRILDDAKVSCVLTTTKALATLEAAEFGYNGATIVVDSVVNDTEHGSNASLHAILAAEGETRRCDDRPMYMVYTSGSTGIPKGVLCSERGMRNLIQYYREDYGLCTNDCVSQIVGAGFDPVGEEVWPTLCCGGRLSICPDVAKMDSSGVALCRWLQASQVTVTLLPAPLAESVMTYFGGSENGTGVSAAVSLRLLISGGDVLRLSSVPDGCNFRVDNHYGPSENTVLTTLYELPHSTTPQTAHSSGESLLVSGQPPPIGSPIRGCAVVVVRPQRTGAGANVDKSYPTPHAVSSSPTSPSDTERSSAREGASVRYCLAPVGTPGELWIGGDSLAVGYGRDGTDAKSLTSFVSNPFPRSLVPFDRLYRTGDCGKRRFDTFGLDFVSRFDLAHFLPDLADDVDRNRQVKVRGARIEIGEIESAFRYVDDVEQCAVIIAEDHVRKSQEVVACVAGAKVYAQADGFDAADESCTTPLPVTGDYADAMLAVLRKYLTPQMLPTYWVAWPTLPVNCNGKVDRLSLKTVCGDLIADMHAKSSASAEQSFGDDVTPEWVRKLLEKCLGRSLSDGDVYVDGNSGDERTFFELGGTSREIAVLFRLVESALGAERSAAIDWSQFLQFPTPSTLYSLLRSKNSKMGGNDGVSSGTSTSEGDTYAAVPTDTMEEAVPSLSDGRQVGDLLSNEISDPDIRLLAPSSTKPTQSLQCNGRVTILTGCTGFLGRFLLWSLVAEAKAGDVIVCLLRACSGTKAADRVSEALQSVCNALGVSLDTLGKVSLRGSETLEEFHNPSLLAGNGVSLFCVPCTFSSTSSSDDSFVSSSSLRVLQSLHIDDIIHAASMVNMVSPLSALAASNVWSTFHLLRLHPKRFHLISTLAVFPNHFFGGDTGESAVNLIETDGVMDDATVIRSGYSQSKVVSEYLVRRWQQLHADAGEMVGATVHRPARVGGVLASGDFPCDPDDFLYQILRMSVAVRVFPELRWTIDMYPVDGLADDIVANLHTAGMDTSIVGFHYYNADVSSLSSLVAFVRDTFDADTAIVPYAEWRQRVVSAFPVSAVRTAHLCALARSLPPSRQRLEDGLPFPLYVAPLAVERLKSDAFRWRDAGYIERCYGAWMQRIATADGWTYAPHEL